MPKVAVPLTDVQIRRAKPQDKPFKLFDGGGLFLEVTPAGAKFWRMKFRQPNGKENLLAFGAYPDVSLAAAREQRSKTKRLLREGVDPARDRDESRRATAAAHENTFKQVATKWHGVKKKSWSDNYAKNVLHRLEMDIFPDVGEIPIDKVSHPDMINVSR